MPGALDFSNTDEFRIKIRSTKIETRLIRNRRPILKIGGNGSIYVLIQTSRNSKPTQILTRKLYTMKEGRASKRQKLSGGKSAPKKASSASKTASSKSAPAKSVPAQSAPDKASPVKPAPAKSSPVKSVPAKSSPVKPASAKPAKPKSAPMPKSTVSRKRPLPKEEYEDVWEHVYLAGTEWSQIEEVQQEEWDFEHLDDALTYGELSSKMVHLFGATEPQLIMRDEEDVKGSIIPVPVIIAVESARPPPSTIGIKSVQRTEEEIIPMSSLKMAWHPHVPDNLTGSRRFNPAFTFLSASSGVLACVT